MKVLDFGLAKAFGPDAAGADVSNSPTLSMQATQQGMILGTAAYMSPGQAKGIPVDKRSDIFSFGCVLFEMLTGRRAFEGELATEILASVITREPDYTTLQANLNPAISALLRRCLEKDSKKRWQDVGDVRVEIEQVLSDPEGSTIQIATPAVGVGSQTLVGWVVAAVAITAVVASLAVWGLLGPVAPGVKRLTVMVPDGTIMNTLRPTLSPDGRMLAFMAYLDGQPQIYTRRLDQLEVFSVRGAEGAAGGTPAGSMIGKRGTHSGRGFVLSVLVLNLALAATVCVQGAQRQS